MTLKIGPNSFQVGSATLTGILFDKSWKKFDPTIHDGINYSLYLKCQTQQVGDQQWRPTSTLQTVSEPALNEEGRCARGGGATMKL
jgi:hypothetical protein